MTREEAIQYLIDTGISPEHIMELVEALEQEPCEDCISRQAVLDLAKFDGRKNLGSIIHAVDVERLPPVTAEKVGQWIPVSERLPEWHWETAGGEKFWVGERVLACVKEADEYYDLVGVATYGPYGWESSDEGFCSYHASKPVIAWMPLPEPYIESPTGEEANT